MPQIVNTNVLSLNAQRNLDRSAGSLATALQRLSSGLRINSAKDDAAGLAISNRMTAQIRGSNQAARNASDAISLAQTGEGGLQELTNNLQRMRELAIQSRNATNTASDRSSLDAEFQQLLAEVDRVAQVTSFNGRNVLDGSLGTSVFQVGANVGETVAVNVSSSMRTSSIGQLATITMGITQELDETDGDGEDAVVLTNALKINGTNVGAATAGSNGLSAGSAAQVAAAINTVSTSTDVTATAGVSTATITAAQINARLFTDAGTDDALTYTLSINGTQVFTETEATVAKTASDLAGQVNSVSGTTGVTATVDSSTGALILATSDGRNIEVNEVLAGSSSADTDLLTTYFGNAIEATIAELTDQVFDVYKGSVTITSGAAFTVLTSGISGATAPDLFSGASAPTDAGGVVTFSTTGVNASSILTETESDAAINRIDQALTDVDNLRGTFGAIQSRFESTIASLQTTAENVSAARARIRDADFAAETANLTRSQILQQAGISVLTQANAQPQLALSLLQ